MDVNLKNNYTSTLAKGFGIGGGAALLYLTRTTAR